MANARVGLRQFALLVLVPWAGSCRCSSRYPKVEAHCHVAPEAVPRAIEWMDRYGISAAVNLSGGLPGRGLEEQLKAAARFPGRIVVFTGLDWYEPTRGPGFGARMAATVEKAHRLGAKGLEIPRGLGIGVRDSKGELIAIDAQELDPVFEKAAELGMPVAIETGAPVAFWLPPIARNERYQELTAHPELSLYGQAPPWETLFLGLERRIAKHPKCTFISVHFGNAAEYPDRVAALLDKYQNLYIDTAGRIPELGRHSRADIRNLFVDHSALILFGSDLSIGSSPKDVVLSSPGTRPPTQAEIDQFFAGNWRYCETADKALEPPTPIHGT